MRSNYEVNGELDLGKLMNCNVKNILGRLIMEFDEPTFKLSKIILEDGREFWCEGEHDMPYLIDGYGDNAGKFDTKLLKKLLDDRA